MVQLLFGSPQTFNSGYGDYVGQTFSNQKGNFDTNWKVVVPSGTKAVKSITAPNGTAYTSFSNFKAPTNAATGSVTVTKADGSGTETLTIPVLQKTNAGVAWTYPTPTTGWTGLLQVLGYAFLYGYPSVSGSSNNNFVVNVTAANQALEVTVQNAPNVSDFDFQNAQSGSNNATGASVLGTTDSNGNTLSSVIGDLSAFPNNYGGDDVTKEGLANSTNKMLSANYYTGSDPSDGDWGNSVADMFAKYPTLDDVDGNIQHYDIYYNDDLTSIGVASYEMTAGEPFNAIGVLNVDSCDAYQNPVNTSRIDPMDPNSQFEPTAFVINGKVIQVTITDSNGKVVEAGPIKTYDNYATNFGTDLGPGKYTVAYSVPDAAGNTITATTTLTVKNPFHLPFAGGIGLMGVGLVAVILVVGSVGVKFIARKKNEDEN